MGKDINWTDKEWKVIIVDDALVESALLEPLRLKRGRKIFVKSMSDLFHPSVAYEMLDGIFAVMALCPLRAGDAIGRGVCIDDDTFAWRVGKKAAGDLLDGQQHHAFPEVP